MKERPIIFSGPMVQAILEGRKTQTRRVIKPQPEYFDDINRIPYQGKNWDKVIKCKFGKVGDLLWVRETWFNDADFSEKPVIIYKASDPDFPRGSCPWRPSIHMPRWASRITLEITDIRVERLQDISESDAIAEGAQCFNDLPSIHPFKQDPRWSMENPSSTEQCLGTPYWAFANYWEKINGAGSWNKNTWVWVIEFKRIN